MASQNPLSPIDTHLPMLVKEWSTSDILRWAEQEFKVKDPEIYKVLKPLIKSSAFVPDMIKPGQDEKNEERCSEIGLMPGHCNIIITACEKLIRSQPRPALLQYDSPSSSESARDGQNDLFQAAPVGFSCHACLKTQVEFPCQITRDEEKFFTTPSCSSCQHPLGSHAPSYTDAAPEPSFSLASVDAAAAKIKAQKALLKRAVPDLRVAEVVDVYRDLFNYNSTQAARVFDGGDITGIIQLYNRWRAIPQARTRRALAGRGVRVVDPPRALPLSHAWRVNGRPVIMKRLAKNRDLHLHELVANEVIEFESARGRIWNGQLNEHFLADFYIVDVHKPPSQNASERVSASISGSAPPTGRQPTQTPLKQPSDEKASSEKKRSSNWVVMPLFTASLCGFPTPLDNGGACRLVFQISRALERLHEKRLIHADVKPANIFVSTAGDFFLGDFNSVSRNGEPIVYTTESFVPSDNDEWTAVPAFDWWMLATTVFDLRSASNDRIGQNGSDKRATKREVVDGLRTLLPQESATQAEDEATNEHEAAVRKLIQTLVTNENE